MHTKRMVALAVAAWMVLPGCGGRSGPDMRSVSPGTAGVELLVTALRSDDPTRAYTLLSESVRQQVSFEEFAAQWATTAAEREDQARALEQELAGSPDLGERTRFTYADGKSVHLVRQGGIWRMETPLVTRFHASHPRDAARLLGQALAHRDYDALMHLLTSRRRDRIGHQLRGFVTSLLEHLEGGADTLEIIDEEHAELRWDDGDASYRIVLRKEGDEWRVDDVHLRTAPPPAGDTTGDPSTDTTREVVRETK